MTNPSFALLFDMDGVLIDSNPYHKISLKQFCKKYGHDLTESALREKIYGRTNRDWLTNLFGVMPEAQLQAYAVEKEALFRTLYKDAIKPLEGLLEFLDLVERGGVRRAIATSAPRANVDFTFEHTGIGQFFEVVLHDTHVTKGKPDPEIYLKSAAAIGVAPEKCIVFEDSLSGIEAAQAAGSKVVGITTTHTADELAGVDLVLDDFRGLTLDRLDQLMRH